MSADVMAFSLTKYTNSRYGYSISFPADLLKALPESDSGDGRVFHAKSHSAEFRVFADGAVEGFDDTPDLIAGSALKNCSNPQQAYRVVKPHLIAISCLAGDDIYYQKTYLYKSLATTMAAKYPNSESRLWNAVVSKMARSLTPASSWNYQKL
jgi:hypothetical protein